MSRETYVANASVEYDPSRYIYNVRLNTHNGWSGGPYKLTAHVALLDTQIDLESVYNAQPDQLVPITRPYELYAGIYAEPTGRIIDKASCPAESSNSKKLPIADSTYHLGTSDRDIKRVADSFDRMCLSGERKVTIVGAETAARFYDALPGRVGVGGDLLKWAIAGTPYRPAGIKSKRAEFEPHVPRHMSLWWRHLR
jgi:hypothetical protein